MMNHNGKIEFQTSESGTEFILSFPKLKEKDADGKIKDYKDLLQINTKINVAVSSGEYEGGIRLKD